MIREFLWPDHSVLCDECANIWVYDLEDAQRYDDGSSLFYSITCPICKKRLLVSPCEYVGEMEQRKRELLSMKK